jgi:hypothetical protein
VLLALALYTRAAVLTSMITSCSRRSSPIVARRVPPTTSSPRCRDPIPAFAVCVAFDRLCARRTLAIAGTVLLVGGCARGVALAVRPDLAPAVPDSPQFSTDLYDAITAAERRTDPTNNPQRARF